MELGPKDYLLIVKRRKWSLIGTAGLVVLISVITALVWPPSYKSVSTILIEEQEIPPDYVMTTVTSYAEQQLQITNQRIMSSTKLLEIVDRVGLYQDLREKLTTEEIVDKMRGDIHLDLINAEVMDRKTGRPATATIAFTLGYEGQDTPGKVQKTADVLASLFLEENLKVREKQASETFIFLEEEAKKVKADLEGLEAKIKTFKEQHADALPEMLQVNVQNLQRLDMDLQQLQSNSQRLEQQKGYLESQLASIPETGLSRKSHLEELKVQLASLTTKFSDEYPDVIKMKAEIAELERMTGDAASTDDKGGTAQPDNPSYITLAAQLASTKSEIASVKQQIKDTTAKVADYNRRIDLTSRVEGEYKTLMNEKNTTELKYNDLIRKTMEARVSRGLEKEQKGGRFTLIDPARLPEKPFKPNRVAIMLIGVVLGVGAGFGMLAVREFIDESVRSVGALAVATSFPVLGSIPEIETEQDKRNKKRKKMLIWLLIVGGIVAGVLLFHFLIMDLDIFWAKLMHRLELLY
ncbi:MAG: hypothetical protein AUK28_05230 [Desulfobacterales bacterium CG2_30_60_27]|nr:MAG: hypothetical protein AUK28_05230 [Desulfobacterales bacterium CG2_30_60_27]